MGNFTNVIVVYLTTSWLQGLDYAYRYWIRWYLQSNNRLYARNVTVAKLRNWNNLMKLEQLIRKDTGVSFQQDFSV